MTLVRATHHYRLGTDDRLLADLPAGSVVLAPTVAELPPKVLTSDLAELWTRLAQPLPLGSLDTDSQRVVRPLVLDGVFAVGIDDATTTGPDAAPLLGLGLAEPAATRTSMLSVAALRLAERRLDYSTPELTAILYRHNTAPASPFWHRAFEAGSALERIKALAGPAWNRIERRWAPQDRTTSDGAGWVFFRADAPGPIRHKLYVSVLPESLAESFARVIAVLADHGWPAFKIGGDVAGLLRPDKLVVYFTTAEAAEAAALALDGALDGLAVQGVPFSYQLGTSGCVSAGADPADDPFGFYSEGNSWRYRICRELAQALKTAAVLGPGGMAPWQAALQRVALNGVDVRTWRPQEWRTK